jgi:hypothetical protein
MGKEIKPTIIRFYKDKYGITHGISDWAAKRVRPSPPLTTTPYYTEPVRRETGKKAGKEAGEVAKSEKQNKD